MVHGILRWVGACLFTVMIVISSAGACTLPEMGTDQRPDRDGDTTQVTVSMIVADLLGVDDVNQQLDIDLIATFSWKDTRLSELTGCRFAVTDVWSPPVNLLNSSNLRFERRNARAQVVIGNDATVTFRNRFTGMVSSYHNLHDFPFDRHAFEIRLSSIDDGVETLEIIADNDNTWIADRLNISGWTVSGVNLSAAATTLPNVENPVSAVTLTINAKRDTRYYVYRVIFWVPPNRFEFQIGLGVTAMLTAIAFNLAIADALPRLGYLTVFDMIMIVAIILIFLSIVEALVAGLLVIAGREAQAVRLDMVSRILFPALLFGGWLYIIFQW